MTESYDTDKSPVIGSFINYTCLAGYSFQNPHSTYRTSKCNINGEWNPPFEQCFGRIEILINLRKINFLIQLMEYFKYIAYYHYFLLSSFLVFIFK